MRPCLRSLLVGKGRAHWLVLLVHHIRKFRCLCVGLRLDDSTIILELQVEECCSLAMESFGESHALGFFPAPNE